MASPTRFCAAWLVSLVAVLALVAAFNVMIDPYDVFGTPRIEGLNAFKTNANTRAALSKAYQIERVHPHAVIIGASTADLGLDPRSPVWPEEYRPVYDFGVPGMLPPFEYQTLQDSAAVGSIKLAVIVLSFPDALAPQRNRLDDRPSDAERRLLVTSDGQFNPARPQQRLQDIFLSTLTLGALDDSIATLLSQRQADALDLTKQGSTTEAGFRETAMAEGYAALFQEKDAEYARKFGQAGRAVGSQSAPLYGLDTIHQMIDFCGAHGIRPIFVIAPYHADFLEIIDRAGLWRSFESWKLELADLVARSGVKDAVLWDFTDYDQYSTEKVPKRHGQSSTMEWFWEPVHFKKALGTLVLQRILTGEPAGFGVMITPANIREHLEDIRTARQAYRDEDDSSRARVSEIFSRLSGRDVSKRFDAAEILPLPVSAETSQHSLRSSLAVPDQSR
jgi:hypothetical protein